MVRCGKTADMDTSVRKEEVYTQGSLETGGMPCHGGLRGGRTRDGQEVEEQKRAEHGPEPSLELSWKKPPRKVEVQ